MQDGNEQAARDKFIGLIRDMDFAMVATRSADGRRMHARPMAYRSNEDDGDLWFFTKRNSRKVAEPEGDANVMVTFADPKRQNFVTISGRGKIVDDRAKVQALWSEIYRAWFPGGPKDPEVVGIRVGAEHAEYWDNPTNAMVYAYGYVKAVVTGKAAKPGDVGAVELG